MDTGDNLMKAYRLAIVFLIGALAAVSVAYYQQRQAIHRLQAEVRTATAPSPAPVVRAQAARPPQSISEEIALYRYIPPQHLMQTSQSRMSPAQEERNRMMFLEAENNRLQNLNNDLYTKVDNLTRALDQRSLEADRLRERVIDIERARATGTR